MRFEIIAKVDGEDVARVQTDNSQVGFNMVRDLKETFTDYGFERAELFVTDKDTKTTHILVIDGDKRYCDGEDQGRFWDSIVDSWFF